MGNSTKTLQTVIDIAKTRPELCPQPSAGGYSNLLALENANDVMMDMLSAKFNWKFNRILIPPFQTISYQQDYASIALKTLGWLEHGVIVDINNTSLPKPVWEIEVVRDLELSSWQLGRPRQACWLPNDQLVQDVWPGAGVTFTNPLGPAMAPSNPKTNIRDANGNILVLTTYGVTGNSAPLAAVGAASGVTVADGSCVWTVADPKAQGFRILPIPTQTGVTLQVYLVGQAKPVQFSALSQLLDPIPDDFSGYFKDGFMLYSKRHSWNPKVRAEFDDEQKGWLMRMAQAVRQGDRERDAARFIPERGIMEGGWDIGVGPAWPYGPS